jgi:competence protein ComEC
MSAPFVWIFVCFAAGILCAQSLTLAHWILFPSLLVAIGAFCCRFRVALVANTLLIILAAGSLVQKQENSYYANPMRDWGRSHPKEVVVFQGVIIRTPEIAEDYFVLQVRIESIAGELCSGVARITVSGQANSALIAGDRIESFAKFRLPRNFRTEGSFDYERYLRTEGVHVLGSIKNVSLVKTIGRESSLRRFSSRIRMASILKTTRSFPDREGSVLRALWLDDRGGMSQPDQQSMIDAGVFHVIAISGFHITVLLFLMFLLLKKFVPFRFAVLIACLLLTGYFLILEGRASVTRSFLSFLIFAFAVWRYDRISLANWICLSALIQLILNPLELYDSGFHLTYLSTAAILFFVVPISQKWIGLRKGYQFALNFLITGVVLQFILMPYQIYVFHRVPLYSVLANSIAVPVSSVLIACSVLFLPLPSASTIVGIPLKILVSCFLSTAGFFGDQGVRILPSPPLLLIFLFYGALIVFVISRKKHWKLISLGMVMIALILVFTWPKRKPDGSLRIHMLDVGQGDSILIEYPDQTFDLVDGGGFFNSDALDTGQSIIIPYLCRKGITKIHRVFLTHAHADHMKGLISLLKYIPVEELYVTRQPLGDRGYQYFLRNINRTPTPICLGKRFNEGPVQLEVLAPDDAAKTMKVANDDSLVLLVKYGNSSILLTGDIESEAENKLAKRIVAPVDFFKVPHHGSRTSSSDLLLERVKPRIAFASVGFNNWFGHPHPDVLERYKRRHVLLFRTDLDGSILIKVSRRGVDGSIN